MTLANTGVHKSTLIKEIETSWQVETTKEAAGVEEGTANHFATSS